MKRFAWAAALTLVASSALAMGDEIVQVKASGDVSSTMDALQAAVKEAGATVFARVDHGAGAVEAGLELGPSELLIFGNPKLGTPAMQDDPLAGLLLPLRVLVYTDGLGQVWLAYEDPKEMLDDLGGISDDADYIEKMTDALRKLTAKAAGS